MVEITIIYQGELRCAATHQPSGSTITTDAPKDNHGLGEGFSPTDLIATALGSCMLTIMGIAARTLQLDLYGTKVTVHKAMVAKPVRRIATLTVKIAVPLVLEEVEQQALVNAAMTCPVYQSLHPDIQVPVEFCWG